MPLGFAHWLYGPCSEGLPLGCMDPAQYPSYNYVQRESAQAAFTFSCITVVSAITGNANFYNRIGSDSLANACAHLRWSLEAAANIMELVCD